jgi:fumarate hydratase class I
MHIYIRTQAKAKITADGIYLEELEKDPAKYLPDVDNSKLSNNVVKIDINRYLYDIDRYQ